KVMGSKVDRAHMTLTNLEIAALKRAERAMPGTDADILASLLSAAARELRANEATPARLRQLGARCFLFSRLLENEPQPSLIARPKDDDGRHEILDPERLPDGSYRGRYRYIAPDGTVYGNYKQPGRFPADEYDFE